MENISISAVNRSIMKRKNIFMENNIFRNKNFSRINVKNNKALGT